MALLEATFETRREAEMSVERLVQEFGLDRKDIMIVANGALNSAGEETSGGDNASNSPSSPPRTPRNRALSMPFRRNNNQSR